MKNDRHLLLIITIMCFLTDLGQTLILVILAVILEFNPTKVGLLNEGCTILIIIVKAVS